VNSGILARKIREFTEQHCSTAPGFADELYLVFGCQEDPAGRDKVKTAP